MTLDDVVIALLLLGTGLVFWQHAKISQRAHAIALKRTVEHNLLLLDESVVLKAGSLKFSRHHGLEIERRYEFEFSSTGEKRYRGTLTLLGDRLTQFQLPPYAQQRETQDTHPT